MSFMIEYKSTIIKEVKVIESDFFESLYHKDIPLKYMSSFTIYIIHANCITQTSKIITNLAIFLVFRICLELNIYSYHP